MAYEFKFPDVGEGIQEGTIVKWLVKEGDAVDADQALGEIETDKAIVEIPSPKAGTIIRLHVKEGGVIRVGQTMVTIKESGEEKKDAGTVIGFLDDGEKQKAEKIHIPRKEGKAGLAAESKGVKVQKKYDMFGYIDRVPFSGIRKAIAEHMAESIRTTAQVTHMQQADVTKLAVLREKEKKKAESEDVKLTYLPYVVKAVVAALKKHPMLNSTLDEAAGEIRVKKYYNIGIAVDEGDGLRVPVVKGADQKDTITIAKEIQNFVNAGKKLNPMDMKGGSFTITNLGHLGVEYFTPVINYPEVAILGMGDIQDEAVVKEGKVVVRKMLPLSLSYDHRVVDGREAALFMKDLVEILFSPA